MRRIASAGLRLLLWVGVLVGMAWGTRGAWRFVTESERFAIRAIHVEGNVRTSEEAIRAALGIPLGENLFVADVRGAASRVGGLPWIREVETRRVFPQAVAVSVLEREAVALVELGNLYLVDDVGDVFKRARPGDPLDLPVLTGLSREAWNAGAPAERERLRIALDALEIINRHPVGKSLPVSELHLGDGSEGITLYLGKRAMQVRLGEGELQAKLDRLERVLEEAERRGRRLEMVRLDNRTRPGWIAARFEAGADGGRVKGRREAPEG